MKPAVQRLYDQMPEPKWVIAMATARFLAASSTTTLLGRARGRHVSAGRRLHLRLPSTPRRSKTGFAAPGAGQDGVDRPGSAHERKLALPVDDAGPGDAE